MNSLVNTNLARTYNPRQPHNALSDIKRLLTSRDTVAQSKACSYIIEAIRRYKENTAERSHMVQYLLENDLTVFLCEATSNLDFSLFRSILSCFRLLWYERRFFLEEHACHCMTAVLRSLAHYANSGSLGAVECCLHFLCDVLTGIKSNETHAPLSRQNAYSAEQLITCLINLAARINHRRNTILSSALVLQALVSYQPVNLNLRGSTAKVLAEGLKIWFSLLMGALKHCSLTGDEDGATNMFFAVTCQLGVDVLRLTKVLCKGTQSHDFIEGILADEQDSHTLVQSAAEMTECVQTIVSDLVMFTKENLNHLPSDEYSVFLKLLLNFIVDNAPDIVADLCDLLFTHGYLEMLPRVQIIRNDTTVRKVSTLLLGEILKVLAAKHLDINGDQVHDDQCVRDIHMGLTELQYGIEKPHRIGQQLQQYQTYSLLIYAYFYCQSSDNPQEATAPLLPYLIEHILCLPKGSKLPKYIIKSLWLVFAMSTISNGKAKSLEERIYLEKATDRFVGLLQPEPSAYYTHNPAILLWAFTSQRIVMSVRIDVLAKWLEIEENLPMELSAEPFVWDLLLRVLAQKTNKIILYNALKALNVCLETGDQENRQDFALVLWSMLPNVLSRMLIDCGVTQATNVCYLLELSTTLVPLKVDDVLCSKIAVLISTIFSKDSSEFDEDRYHFEYCCLKISLYLLGLSYNQNDSRVLITYVNRPGFLPNVLRCTNSIDARVACTSLQLLSYIVHYFTKSQLQPKSIIEVETSAMIKSLREDSTSERSASLLQLVYMLLNSGPNTPLVLSSRLDNVVDEEKQCKSLMALMFRVQMLCCKESSSQSSAGWKTLSSIFKYAIVSKNDPKFVAALTTQPWTHVLIQFQISQKITEEFLTFLSNWLMLFKITIKKNSAAKKRNQIVIFKESIVFKTMNLLKKSFDLKKEDEFLDTKQKVLISVKEILEESYGSTRIFSGAGSL